ncbi:MAG TPA: hypothetical protein VMY39_07870, partial [Planctomycetota bacterium]|nr:hypothetical protein [Planctomycetota bacterium]
MVDPNPGELLGVDPEHCTAAEVKQALRDRKVTLRLSLPGPQYVPVVPRYEKTLNRAAATLIAPDRRGKRLRQPAAETRSDASRQERAARRGTLIALQEMIGRSLAPDGTLDARGRAALAEDLRRHGADAHIVASVLAEIPRPLSDRDRSSSRTRKFFVETVRMVLTVRGGGMEVRQDLVSLAGRLNVPTDLAERTLVGGSDEMEPGSGDRRRVPAWVL